MVCILTIERKIGNVRIQSCYFTEEIVESNSKVHVKAFSHSFIPRKSLKRFETLQIHLAKDEQVLSGELHKTTRRQIKKAEEIGLKHIIIENPTNEDLQKFQLFYNEFAKNKKTYACNSYHMKTMQLLRDQKAIILTYMQNSEEEIYCYRIYIVNGKIAMNLYSASHYRMVENSSFRRILGQANRLLIWKCILWFKRSGYDLYDMGGLTNEKNIRQFKLGFGGEIIPVYSGYEAKTMIGLLFVALRKLKINLAIARNIT